MQSHFIKSYVGTCAHHTTLTLYVIMFVKELIYNIAMVSVVTR